MTNEQELQELRDDLKKLNDTKESCLAKIKSECEILGSSFNSIFDVKKRIKELEAMPKFEANKIDLIRSKFLNAL